MHSGLTHPPTISVVSDTLPTSPDSRGAVAPQVGGWEDCLNVTFRCYLSVELMGWRDATAQRQRAGLSSLHRESWGSPALHKDARGAVYSDDAGGRNWTIKDV